jgi:hypothetical protein
MNGWSTLSKIPLISLMAASLSPSSKPPITSSSFRRLNRTLSEWQTATEVPIMAAEGRGPLIHARIGILRALNRNVERVFNPDRKDTHRGKRKLKRDQ